MQLHRAFERTVVKIRFKCVTQHTLGIRAAICDKPMRSTAKTASTRNRSSLTCRVEFNGINVTASFGLPYLFRPVMDKKSTIRVVRRAMDGGIGQKEGGSGLLAMNTLWPTTLPVSSCISASTNQCRPSDIQRCAALSTYYKILLQQSIQRNDSMDNGTHCTQHQDCSPDNDHDAQTMPPHIISKPAVRAMLLSSRSCQACVRKPKAWFA